MNYNKYKEMIDTDEKRLVRWQGRYIGRVNFGELEPEIEEVYGVGSRSPVTRILHLPLAIVEFENITKEIGYAELELLSRLESRIREFNDKDALSTYPIGIQK